MWSRWVLLAGFALSPGLPGRSRRAVAVAVALGNNGQFMGLPISMFALGRLGFDQSVLIFLASVVLTFVVAPAVYGAEGGVRGTVRAVLRLPAIWAMGVALLVRNLGLPVPVGIGRGIELLSQATLPVLLLALVCSLARAAA